MSNGEMSDKEACVAHCTWNEHKPCYKSSYTNSIFAGCPFAGLLAHGHSCLDPVGASTTSSFKNIVAHSIHGSGVSMLPDVSILSDALKCYQMSHIFAYKNDQAGIATMYSTNEIRASNIVLVDNQLGISLSITEDNAPEKLIKISDSYIFGEAGGDLPNDCPDGTTGTTGAVCYCPDKFGFMS